MDLKDSTGLSTIGHKDGKICIFKLKEFLFHPTLKYHLDALHLIIRTLSSGAKKQSTINI